MAQPPPPTGVGWRSRRRVAVVRKCAYSSFRVAARRAFRVTCIAGMMQRSRGGVRVGSIPGVRVAVLRPPLSPAPRHVVHSRVGWESVGSLRRTPRLERWSRMRWRVSAGCAAGTRPGPPGSRSPHSSCLMRALLARDARPWPLLHNSHAVALGHRPSRSSRLLLQLRVIRLATPCHHFGRQKPALSVCAMASQGPVSCCLCHRVGSFRSTALFTA